LSQQQLVEYSFYAGLHQLDAASKTATFYIMNTSRNRNRWGVTEKALAEALPSLKGKKLGMGLDYRTDKHYPDGQTMDVGVFVAFDNKGSYATGDAKISDAKAWRMLEKGELGATSVVIHAYHVACSLCGAELEPNSQAVENHPCFKTSNAYEQVHSFVFARVDFVDVPAYPQAGLLELASQSSSRKVPLELLAGFYVSQNSESSLTGDTKKVTEKIEEFEKKISALEQEKQELQNQIAELKQAAVANAEAKKTIAELKAALDAVKAELKAKADQEHAALVEQAYKARVEAGIAGDEKLEREMLAKHSNDVLSVFIADAQKVSVKLQAQGSNPVPKTKYNAQTVTDLKAAIAERRASYGFAPKIENGGK